jgi:prophage antirepressor-like protein
MKSLSVYKNQYFGELEVLIEDGKEWFPATFTAQALGYSNPRKAIKDHCKMKGVTIRSVLTEGGMQERKYIDEGNLYRLIIKSKLPSAERFEEWIFDEVIPQIRRTGLYLPKLTLSVDQAMELSKMIRNTERSKLPSVKKILSYAGIELADDSMFCNGVESHLIEYIDCTSLKGMIPVSEVYNDYAKWCVSQGIVPVSQCLFGHRIQRCGIKKHRTSNTRFFVIQRA